MKRMLFIILAGCIFLPFGGCSQKGTEPSENLYETACKTLQEEPLNLSANCLIDQNLIDALYAAEYSAPKSVIFMIGDGMGFNAVTLTEYLYSETLYEGKLAMHYLPVQSAQTTYSASDDTTDSAAGGTALACGYKTANGVVGKTKDKKENLRSNLELAAEKGKSTGIISTTSVTDATPASFTAHADTRADQENIAAQQLAKLADGTLDLALGGGAQYYASENNAQALSLATKAGLTYTGDWQQAKDAALPLAGLFAEDLLDTKNAPSLSAMTDLALTLLGQDENGFFLMIEGSQIDKGGHKNNIEYESEELYEFDRAVSVAMRYVALHPDTLLLVTADHETGGLRLPPALSEETIDKVCYDTTGHSGYQVPVYAVGYQTERLSGPLENTDLAAFVAEMLSDSTESRTEYAALFDLSEEQTIKEIAARNSEADQQITVLNGVLRCTFSGPDMTLLLPIEHVAEAKNRRTIYCTVKNCSDQYAPLPEMLFIVKQTSVKTRTAFDYLAPGESRTVAFNVHRRHWADKFEKLTDLGLSISSSAATSASEEQSYTLEFSNFIAGCRQNPDY